MSTNYLQKCKWKLKVLNTEYWTFQNNNFSVNISAKSDKDYQYENEVSQYHPSSDMVVPDA